MYAHVLKCNNVSKLARKIMSAISMPLKKIMYAHILLTHAIFPCHVKCNFYPFQQIQGPQHRRVAVPSPCCFSTFLAPEKSRQPMWGCQVTHVGESFSSWLPGKPNEQPKKMSGSYVIIWNYMGELIRIPRMILILDDDTCIYLTHC